MPFRLVLLPIALAALGCRPAAPAGSRLACPPGMQLVPEGSFVMGTRSGEALAHNDESPAHEVWLPAYCLDRHEVTDGEFAARSAARPASACRDCPATAVTWVEAEQHCAARGARLPSEAEFERAARAGSPDTWPWGPDWRTGAARVNGRDLSLAAIEPDWVPEEERGHDDGHPGPAPACALGRDALGFCDLLGNAAEWCHDRWAPGEYSFARARDPRGPRDGRARVVRGGSFADGPRDLRPATRTALDGAGRSALVGFRCAAAPIAAEATR